MQSLVLGVLLPLRQAEPCVRAFARAWWVCAHVWVCLERNMPGPIELPWGTHGASLLARVPLWWWQTLVALVGSLDATIARIPDKYCRAVFGSRLASRFIYEHGLNTPEFAFFEFVSKSVM